MFYASKHESKKISLFTVQCTNVEVTDFKNDAIIYIIRTSASISLAIFFFDFLR